MAKGRYADVTSVLTYWDPKPDGLFPHIMTSKFEWCRAKLLLLSRG